MQGLDPGGPMTGLDASAEAGGAPARSDDPAYDVIELFFFAYRDFVGDPDRLLDELGFGRAHHRVLHFVARQPGLAVAELLNLLKITKQSLNRVLKELVGQGFVESRPGTQDPPAAPSLPDGARPHARPAARPHPDAAHPAGARRRPGRAARRAGPPLPARHDRARRARQGA